MIEIWVTLRLLSFHWRRYWRNNFDFLKVNCGHTKAILKVNLSPCSILIKSNYSNMTLVSILIKLEPDDVNTYKVSIWWCEYLIFLNDLFFTSVYKLQNNYPWDNSYIIMIFIGDVCPKSRCHWLCLFRYYYLEIEYMLFSKRYHEMNLKWGFKKDQKMSWFFLLCKTTHIKTLKIVSNKMSFQYFNAFEISFVSAMTILWLVNQIDQELLCFKVWFEKNCILIEVAGNETYKRNVSLSFNLNKI